MRKNKPSTRSALILEELSAFIQTHCTAETLLLLGFSGGLDSSVLLHALASIQKKFPFKLHAMHVHHGLSQHADAWADFCVRQCQVLQVPMQVVRVQVNLASDLGIEGEARQLRYAALQNHLHQLQAADFQPTSFIITAHHQHDQAETLLLQLMRGAGVKGLASMAKLDVARRLMRPLLDVSRDDLLAYAKHHALNWCEDDSNQNTQYTRNYLRHAVMPVLEKRAPAIQQTLAKSASHFAEASELLDQLAQLDAATVIANNRLHMPVLASLNHARAKNVVRWWLAQNDLQMPNSLQIAEILQQLLHAKLDANIEINLQGKILRRYQQQAYLCEAQADISYQLNWQGEENIKLPNGDNLLFTLEKGAGLALDMTSTQLTITTRKGGEVFKPEAKRPVRGLKYLLQTAKIPPWQRGSWPLIYWQNQLVCVPMVGYAHNLQAKKDDFGLAITLQQAAL